MNARKFDVTDYSQSIIQHRITTAVDVCSAGHDKTELATSDGINQVIFDDNHALSAHPTVTTQRIQPPSHSQAGMQNPVLLPA